MRPAAAGRTCGGLGCAGTAGAVGVVESAGIMAESRRGRRKRKLFVAAKCWKQLRRTDCRA